MAHDPSEILTWSFPGAPFRILLPIAVMRKLDVAIAERGCSRETGGVLLGFVNAAQSSIEIDDFVCIGSAAGSQSGYLLNPDELPRVQNQTDAGGVARQVLGYFRTQLRGDLELREAELDLVKQHFADPANIVLLIHPAQKTAGFFFWCGDFFTPASFQDFRFEATQAGVDAPVQEEPPSAPRLPSHRGVSESLVARATLATGLAVLTVAFTRGPSLGVMSPPPRQASAATTVTASTPVKLESAEPDSKSASEVPASADRRSGSPIAPRRRVILKRRRTTAERQRLARFAPSPAEPLPLPRSEAPVGFVWR